MAIGRLAGIQIDCIDPMVVARFWAGVLGTEPQEPLGDPPQYVNLGRWNEAPDAVMVAFQRVPERKVVKNRVHLDVEVQDVESATAHIETLGGSRLATPDFREYGYSWRVMADPEGNEFCLIFEAAE